MFHTRNNKKKSATMGVELHLLKPLSNLPINSRPSSLLNNKKTILLLPFLKRKQRTTFNSPLLTIPLNSRQPPLLHSTFVCHQEENQQLFSFLPFNRKGSNPYNIILLAFYKAKGRYSSCDLHGSSGRLRRGCSWRVVAAGMTDSKQKL